nr:hypothetical protein [Tanacetum cinerariifolium]
MKCILEGPYTLSIVVVLAVPATENSPAVPEHTTVETLQTMSPENKAHYESEKEAIHLILNGIRDGIYSTVDACKNSSGNVGSYRKVTTRFVMIVKQQHKLEEVSYHKLFDILKQYQKEVNELCAEGIARNAKPLTLVATAQSNHDPYYQTPKSHKPYSPTSKASIPTRSYATTKHKGKEIVKPITPPSESASEEDSDPKQAQRDKDMHENLALIAKYFKKIYKPTKNNLKTSLNSKNKNVDTTLRKPKKVKDSTYQKEKMLLCKQAEKGIPLQAEHVDWLEDTDDKIDKQELEAHYSFMEKIKEVTDQNAEDEHVALANLIANLKVDVDENKKIQKQLKKANTSLAHWNSANLFLQKLQTSVVTTAMTAILKQFQATPPPASVKAVEEICVTCGGAHPYYQCLAADGNTFSELQDNIQGYVLEAAVNYNQGNFSYRPPGVANQIRPPASMSNQTNELKNMMASFFRMNTSSTSGSKPLPSNTITNPKGELKAIITQSGIVLDGPSVPMPPPFIYLEEEERVEETLMDQDLTEYTIKVHINITLADALILIPKYQNMLKALLSNKEKLLELANTPLNENCSAVILKKLLEKLGDPGKFLIPCGFSFPELISTRMTLELANGANCTPAGVARDVFVLVGKFTFPADFVIVDYESDHRVPLILERPFLRTARTLIDVHGEEMILHDGDERLTLNMRHDTSSNLNQPKKESINMINIYDDSYEDFLEDLFATNHLSGSPTLSSHTNLTSSKVKDDIFDLEGDMVLIEKLINLDYIKDLPPPHNINPLSGCTTSSFPNNLLEEFADELALITFPSRNDDLLFDIESDLKEIEYLLNHDPIKEMDSILKDSVDEDNLADLNDNPCIRTRSSSNLPGESSPNPTSLNSKRRNRRHSKQPFILEESPVDTMADQHTMTELLRAPTGGYAEAIMVPSILAE